MQTARYDVLEYDVRRFLERQAEGADEQELKKRHRCIQNTRDELLANRASRRRVTEIMSKIDPKKTGGSLLEN